MAYFIKAKTGNKKVGYYTGTNVGTRGERKTYQTILLARAEYNNLQAAGRVIIPIHIGNDGR